MLFSVAPATSATIAQYLAVMNLLGVDNKQYLLRLPSAILAISLCAALEYLRILNFAMVRLYCELDCEWADEVAEFGMASGMAK